MEVVICLWSYDDRWMFEQKFSKAGWVYSIIFQSVILLTSIMMGFCNTDMNVWIGFRLMVSLGTFISCVALAVTFDNRGKVQKKFWNHLEFFVALLGCINILLTWNLNFNIEESDYFRYCGQLQVFLYIFALAPMFFTFVGYFIIKVFYLVMAFVKPRSLVKIR